MFSLSSFCGVGKGVERFTSPLRKGASLLYAPFDYTLAISESDNTFLSLN